MKAPSLRLALVLSVAAVLTAAGCGGDTTQVQKTGSETPVAPSSPEKSSPTESPVSRTSTAQPDAGKARDRKRAKEFLKDYGADGRSRWLIKSVSVEGGAVTVKTGLYPKADNEPQFTGACSSLMDWEDWMSSLEVLGSDGLPHATWREGDAFCKVSV